MGSVTSRNFKWLGSRFIRAATRGTHINKWGIRQTAEGHLNKLKTQMENDMKYRQDYIAFMQDIAKTGFAERVSLEQLPSDNGKSWYNPPSWSVPPSKAWKTRNSLRLQCNLHGPFMKQLPSSRSRLNEFPSWWTLSILKRIYLQYRMTVHLFEAASSPGYSNFGLKKTATDNEFGSEVNFIRKDFCVDDGLMSAATVSKATSFID